MGEEVDPRIKSQAVFARIPRALPSSSVASVAASCWRRLRTRCAPSLLSPSLWVLLQLRCRSLCLLHRFFSRLSSASSRSARFSLAFGSGARLRLLSSPCPSPPSDSEDSAEEGEREEDATVLPSASEVDAAAASLPFCATSPDVKRLKFQKLVIVNEKKTFH